MKFLARVAEMYPPRNTWDQLPGWLIELSLCLQLWSRSQGPGTQPCIGLSAQNNKDLCFHRIKQSACQIQTLDFRCGGHQGAHKKQEFFFPSNCSFKLRAKSDYPPTAPTTAFPYLTQFCYVKHLIWAFKISKELQIC